MENKRPQKIKIALVAPSMKNVGGQSIQAQRLIEAFAGDENVLIILIPNDPDLETFGFLQRLKVIRTIATSLKFWWSLMRQIPKFDFVQIYSSGTTGYIISTIPPLFISKLFGKKTILNYHHGGLEEHIEEWKLTAKPTMKMFDEIVVPSQFLVDVFAKFGFDAKPIYNFIDTEKFVFRRRKPLRPVFLSNRNFEADYNVGCILKAFGLIQSEIPEARLIVAGYGREESELKKLAETLKLKNVEFVGRVENSEMPKIYDRADVFLNASLVDNLPLSFIEAFACGLPVVSSSVGGIPLLVENGETGILIEENNCRTLARETVKLMENAPLAEKIISQAFVESRKYSSEKVIELWRSFYQDFSG